METPGLFNGKTAKEQIMNLADMKRFLSVFHDLSHTKFYLRKQIEEGIIMKENVEKGGLFLFSDDP